MKKLIAFALCALFAIHSAEARTLYVDASRPNNKGNGLSMKKAKKTLQAAINIAKNGDTILVYPGTYAAPLKTKNKKIKIKAKSGAATTFIRPSKWLEGYVLNLGSGTDTQIIGFTISPNRYSSTYLDDEYDPETGKYVEVEKTYYSYSRAGGVKGGSLSKCELIEIGGTEAKWTFLKSKLADCVLDNCACDTFGNYFSGCTANRCRISRSGSSRKGIVKSSTFANTLVSGTYDLELSSCVLANCTLAENYYFTISKTKAYNTIFDGVEASQFKKSKKNKLTNCYTGNDPKFVGSSSSDEDDYYSSGLDYHLTAGSPCIDKGTKAKAAKKLFGTKDLDGKKRIKGKSIDIGCYEY